MPGPQFGVLRTDADNACFLAIPKPRLPRSGHQIAPLNFPKDNLNSTPSAPPCSQELHRPELKLDEAQADRADGTRGPDPESSSWHVRPTGVMNFLSASRRSPRSDVKRTTSRFVTRKHKQIRLRASRLAITGRAALIMAGDHAGDTSGRSGRSVESIKSAHRRTDHGHGFANRLQWRMLTLSRKFPAEHG